MPSSEEESLWLVGSEANAQPHHHHHQQHQRHGIESHHPLQYNLGASRLGAAGTVRLYTEEMQQSSNSSSAAVNANPPANNNNSRISSQTVSVTGAVSNNATVASNLVCNDSSESDLIDNAADTSLLVQFHQDAIKQAGVGKFQSLAALYVGLCLAADTVEFFALPYILPSAEVELCIEDSEKGWLGKITLLGLAIGGIFWGGLGDHLGRRRSLLTAMSVHALFSGVATFMPTYGTFMSTRFGSAIGVGGALPLAYTYIAECCPPANRAKWTGLLVSAGAFGGVYAALIAWAVVPTTGEMVVLENKEHFSAWHRFLMLCCFPAFSATVGLIFLPESPRYLVEAGRDVEAMMVYQKIYKKNNAQKIAGAQYQLSELELPNKRPRGLAPPSPDNHNRSVLAEIMCSIKKFWSTFLGVFSDPYLKGTIALMIMWSATAFGLFGLMTWCPEYIKYLRSVEYKSHTTKFIGKEYLDQTFSGSLENRQYKDTRFQNCKFYKLVISHVDFDNCTFQSVEFSNIKTSKTHFTDSVIVDSKFIDTDLSSQVFTRCKLENNTKLSLSGPCPTLDLDYNIYIEEVIHSHLAAQLTIVPSAALAGLILTVGKRSIMIGSSLFLSSIVSLCLLLVGSNSAAVLGFEASFVALLAFAITALIVLTIEYYPAHLRCTGFGVMAACVKISALVATIAYQMLIGVPLLVPALLTAIVLLVASLGINHIKSEINMGTV